MLSTTPLLNTPKDRFFNDKINMFSPGFNSFQHLGYACAEYKYIQMKLFLYKWI